MHQIDYSVIIRTIGKAGEKYQKLLDSIRLLEPQPREVIIILPDGCSLPEEKLGWETFCYSPKGMVIQRMRGVEYCKTRYALFCDDDVSFSPDFVKKLYEPLRQGMGEFSIGPLYSFLPPKGKNALICAIMTTASPTFFHKHDRYVSVMKSSGYSYNRNLKTDRYYETQSAPWTCFFADIQALQEVDLEAEHWLDSHGYAAMDDQTMFYKAWLQGKKTIVVPDALYDHMDAKTSMQNNKPSVLYSMQFNRLVFWHRFLYKQSKVRTVTALCYSYRLLWQSVYNLVNLARKRISVNDCKIMLKGWLDGWAYIHSSEYAGLPEIK